MQLKVNVKDFGSYTFDLNPDIAPIACSKIINIAKLGLYNNHKIERLEPGFVLQPLFSDGEHPLLDEEIELEAKTIPQNNALHFERGTVAMAGTATTASAAQYFVTLEPLDRLNGNFTIIGKIVDGWDTLEKIEKAEVLEGTVEEGSDIFHFHYPKTDIIIERVTIEE